MRQNSSLYLVLSAMCVFSVAAQVFFPYLILYLQHVVLPASGELLCAPVIGCALAAVAFIAVAFLLLMRGADRLGRENVFLIAGVLFCAGLFALFFVKRLAAVLLAAAPVAVGYALLTILLSACVRDLTPQDRVGQFQGVRMVFFVLIPMVAGPLIGNIAIQNSAVTYINEYNVEAILPSSSMFLCAAAVGLLVFIPVAMLKKRAALSK